MSVLKHVFVASLCHIPVAQSVELQPHCTGERKRERERKREGRRKRLMEIMRERERERQTDKNRRRERQSDSIGSRGWWLPWGAMSGWRRVRERERDGERVTE